jgi:hypothetical protein
MHLYNSPPEVVRCPRCLKFWKPGNIACAVMHVGEGCCHYGDTEVTATGETPPGWPWGATAPWINPTVTVTGPEQPPYSVILC